MAANVYEKDTAWFPTNGQTTQTRSGKNTTFRLGFSSCPALLETPNALERHNPDILCFSTVTIVKHRTSTLWPVNSDNHSVMKTLQ